MGSELAAIWGCNSVNIVSLCSSEGFKNVAFCFTATVFLFVYRSLSFLLWPLMFPLFSSSPFSLSPAASLCYCHFPFPVGVKFASIIIMLFCVYGLPWHILCVQRLFIKLGKTNYKMPKPTFSAAKKKKKKKAACISDFTPLWICFRADQHFFKAATVNVPLLCSTKLQPEFKLRTRMVKHVQHVSGAAAASVLSHAQNIPPQRPGFVSCGCQDWLHTSSI